jgi:hypothetical protein
MRHRPQLDEPDIEKGLPQRAGGITPLPGLPDVAVATQK